MRTGLMVLTMLVAAPAMAQETEARDGGSEIVVTGHQPLKLDARILRAAQARFAEDRAELLPAGALLFELWRGGTRMRADGLQLSLSDEQGHQVPVAIDGDGRVVFGAIPKGRWFLTAPAQGYRMTLRPIVLSNGTSMEDRRLGDLRMQCRVAVSMAKTQMSFLALPLVGMFDAIGGCASKRVHVYHRMERPLASAIAIGSGGGEPRFLPLTPKRTAYLPPLSDRALGNETRIRATYQ